MTTVLGFDVGGTKTAWGSFDSEGTLLESGSYPTPGEAENFIKALEKVIKKTKPAVVGIGMPGTLNPERTGTLTCTNIPGLSNLNIQEKLAAYEIPVVVDNDARCAMIGEIWKGSAGELASAVLVTIGTGVGGAVMEGGRVRPHPGNLDEEIGRIVVDPTDVFPSRNGAGTVEAFLGGLNIQDRFQIDLKEMAKKVRTGNKEAAEVWHAISYYFITCMRAIYNEYNCAAIIIGGIGSKDLEYYLQDPPPCPIIAAQLGADAGFYGAARLALDSAESSGTE